MADKYVNFKQLSAVETEGADFRIVSRVKRSGTVIVAPHGGGIEPGTSEIAMAVAGDNLSYYSFEGLKPNRNRDLHITSSRFDEPRCIMLIESSPRVITIHGEKSKRNVVFVGGRDGKARARISFFLRRHGFIVRRHENPSLQGLDDLNICNRGKSGAGVQLEIAVGLRRRFFKSLSSRGRKHTTDYFHKFISAVRKALYEN